MLVSTFVAESGLSGLLPGSLLRDDAGDVQPRDRRLGLDVVEDIHPDRAPRRRGRRSTGRRLQIERASVYGARP